ncbi:MAG: PKD domain-containing protein, partial [Thermoproteota archaeon]|nr:PKD domain-containing protein [Thermoproteota archaeon]
KYYQDNVPNIYNINKINRYPFIVVHNGRVIVNMPLLPGISRMFSPSFSFSSTTIRLATSTIGVAIILLASNSTLSVAQQDQPITNQASPIQNITSATANSSALSTEDSFRVQIPQGWLIQDVKNTGFALGSEVLQGYGILAQLCPVEQEEQQQQQQQQPLQGVPQSDANSNVSSTTDGTCQGVQEEMIHILRYPNLAARIGLSLEDIIRTDNVSAGVILAYQMQKLQEAGYRDVRVVNSSDITINVDFGTGLENNITTARLPAKLVELTYTTNRAPDEPKRGYFVSAATHVTPHNLGLVTGYGIFYEGSVLEAATPKVQEHQTTIQTGNVLLQPLTPIKQVIDSFELIAGPEIVQALLAAQTPQVAEQEQPENTLTVEIDSNSTEGAVPATFEFEADITGGTEPYTIVWDLDDDEIAESNEETLVPTFIEPGTHTIDVVVADDGGQVASDSLEVTVEEGEESPLEEQPPMVQEEEQLIEEMPEEETSCDSSYPNLCIPPPPPILACDDVEATNFEVQSPDPHGFDVDNDGIGCETENNQQVDSNGEPSTSGINDSPGIGGIIDRAIGGFSNSNPT